MVAPLSPMARLRWDVVDRLLDTVGEADSLLEVGCGEGGMATLLVDRFDYVGYEPDKAAFEVAQSRLGDRQTARVVNTLLPETPERVFDILGAFEVLEHLEDDATSLQQWVRWVAPGGHVIVSVPAHQHRFGAADDAVGHFRRYSRAGLRALLSDAGLFELTTIAYGFPLGYALEWVRNRMLAKPAAKTDSKAERTAASGRTLQPSARLAGPISAVTLPFAYLQRPFAATDRGTGWVALARRPA